MNWIRAVALVLAALFLGACSGGDDATLVTPTTSAVDATTVPEAIPFSDDDAADRPILRVGVPRLPFVAPHVVDETDPVEVLVTDLMTDGLTELDPATGRARAALAEDWSVSADRLTWSFTLRPATFSTGDPITAVDVATSLNRLAARGADSLSGPTLAVVEGYDEVASGEATTLAGVAVIDDTTLSIELAEIYEPLPELLAGVSFGVFPVDIDTSGTLPLSSSVRFRPAVSWEDGFRMVAIDSEDDLQGVELWIDPAGDRIESAEVAVAVGLDDDDEFAGDLVEVSVPRSASAYYAFNLSQAPFDDVLVRQAILQSIDRPALVEAHFAADPLTGLVPVSVAGGAEDACAPSCTLNGRAAARKLRRAEGADVDFTVDYFADEDGTEQQVAQDIVLALREAGLNATARGHSVDEYGELIAAGELGMFRFGTVSTALVADSFLLPFVTGGADNVTGVSLPDFDELIADARSTVDAAERDALYAEAEVMLHENAVVVPLVEFAHRVLHTAELEAFSLEADGSLDLDSVVFAG